MPKPPPSHVPMRASLRTIANAAGVSINTVSNIVNRGKDALYKPETIEAVRKIAQECGYRPNFAAKMLLTNSSQMIGFVTWTLEPTTGTVANPVVYPFLIGANDYLHDFGYHVVLVGIKELRGGTQRIPKSLENHFFDGLFLQQGRWEHFKQWQDSTKTPIVHWDSGVMEDFNCLYRDEIAVAVDLTQRLFDLGHRKIAFALSEQNLQRVQRFFNDPVASALDPGQPLSTRNLSADRLHYSSIHRHQGYLEVMKRNGLSPSYLTYTARSSIADQMLKLQPTAIVTYSDRNYYVIDRACQLLGWSIPRRVSVACCDLDWRMPTVEGIEFGGITYDRYIAGQQGAEMMLRLVRGEITEAPSQRLLGEFRLGDTIAGFGG